MINADWGSTTSHRRQSKQPAICSARAALFLLALCVGLVAAPVAWSQPACPPTIVSGDGQSGSAGYLTAPLGVKQYANFVSVPTPSSVTFTYTITSGDAAFPSGSRSFTTSAPFVLDNPPVYVASALGTAAPQVMLGSTPGPVVVSVTTNVCPSAGSAFTLTNSGTAPAALGTIAVLAGEGERIPTGQTAGLAVSLTAGASEPTTLNSIPVTFTITAGDATFVASGSRSLEVDGSTVTRIAGALLRAGNTPGPVAIAVSAPGYVPNSINLSVVERRIMRIVSGDQQTGLPGNAGAPLVVFVGRADGSALPATNVLWSVSPPTALLLDNPLTTTSSNGQARNTFTFGNTPAAATVTAALDDGTSVQFTLRSARPSGTLRLVSGDGQTGAIGSEADQPLVFELRTTDGVPAAGHQVDFAVLEGSAQLRDTHAVTDALGRVAAHFRYGTQAGPIRIQASALGAAAQASANAYLPALRIVSGNQQRGLVQSRLPLPLVVEIAAPAASSLAKGLSGVMVNWSVVSGAGSLSNSASQTDASGRANNTWTLGAAPGPQTVRASIAGLGSVEFTATADPLPPPVTGGQFEIVSGNNQTLVPGTASAPLVVRVRGAGGQALGGIAIHWSLSPADAGSLASLITVTDAAGQAATQVTLELGGPARITASIAEAGAPAPVAFSVNGGLINLGELTPRQRNVAQALDAACPALNRLPSPTPAQQELLQRCRELNRAVHGRPSEVRGALQELFSDQSGPQNRVALATATTQLDNLKARFVALRSGARGTWNGLNFVGPGGALPLSFLPSAILGNQDAEDSPASTDASAAFSRWGFFATGTLGQGRRDGSVANSGFSFDTYGLTAGIDYRYSDRFVLGAALGYNQNSTDVNGDRGSMDVRGTSMSAYATYYWDQSFYADATLTHGRNRYDLERRIRYRVNTEAGETVINQVASASPDGSQTALAVSTGRDFQLRAWNFTPYLQATYTRIDFDGYRETLSLPNAPGAGLGFQVDERRLKSLEGVLGARVAYAWSTAWGVLTPHLQLEWLHEFEDQPENATMRFVHDPNGTPILVPSEPVDTGYANFGLGLSGVFGNGRSGFLYYERRAGQRDLSQDSLAAGVRIEF